MCVFGSVGRVCPAKRREQRFDSSLQLTELAGRKSEGSRLEERSVVPFACLRPLRQEAVERVRFAAEEAGEQFVVASSFL